MQVFRSAVRLRQPITPLLRSTLQYTPICTINHNRISTIFRSTTRSYSDGSGKEYRQNIFGTPFLDSSLSEGEVKVKGIAIFQKKHYIILFKIFSIFQLLFFEKKNSR